MLQILISLVLFLGLQVAKIIFYYTFYLFLLMGLRIVWKVGQLCVKRSTFMDATPDQAILITGATSGIGLALAKFFHRQGFSVIVCYYSKQEPGYEQLQRANAESPGNSRNRYHFVALDVRSQDSIERSYELVKNSILKEHKLKLHALINNAGVAAVHRIQWYHRDKIRAIIETNLLGPILMTRQYIPLLARNANSRIINTSSLMSWLVAPFNSVYGATKVGLSHFTNAIALDLAPNGPKTVTIYPGDMLRNTAIIADLTSDLDRIYSDLTQEEKDLYKLDFDHHRKYLAERQRALERARSQAKQTKVANRPVGPFKQVLRILEKFAGQVPPELNLEDTELMESYDYAVRMANPPANMFAGNRLYSVVFATFLESLDKTLLMAFAKMAAEKYQRSSSRASLSR